MIVETDRSGCTRHLAGREDEDRRPPPRGQRGRLRAEQVLTRPCRCESIGTGIEAVGADDGQARRQGRSDPHSSFVQEAGNVFGKAGLGLARYPRERAANTLVLRQGD